MISIVTRTGQLTELFSVTARVFVLSLYLFVPAFPMDLLLCRGATVEHGIYYYYLGNKIVEGRSMVSL